MLKKCNKPCEVYSRVVGFYSPIARWNKGKKEEFKKRTTFDIKKSLCVFDSEYIPCVLNDSDDYQPTDIEF